MKIIVKCENCGNEVEIAPVTQGNAVDFSDELLENNFHLYGVIFDADFLDDTVSDPDDIDIELKEICIACKNCGEQIILNI